MSKFNWNKVKQIKADNKAKQADYNKSNFYTELELKRLIVKSQLKEAYKNNSFLRTIYKQNYRLSEKQCDTAIQIINIAYNKISNDFGDFKIPTIKTILESYITSLGINKIPEIRTISDVCKLLNKTIII